MAPHGKQVPLPGGVVRKMNGVTFCFRLHKPDSMKRRNWELSVQIYRGNDFSSGCIQDTVQYGGKTSNSISRLSTDKGKSRYLRPSNDKPLRRSSIQIRHNQSYSDEHRIVRSSKRESSPFKASKLRKSESIERTSPVSETSQSNVQHCRLCGTVKTGQWRRGPDGPRTLCNACGLDWSKKLKLEASKRGTEIPPLDIENVVAEGWWKTSARRRNQSKAIPSSQQKAQLSSSDIELDKSVSTTSAKRTSSAPPSPHISDRHSTNPPSSSDMKLYTEDRDLTPTTLPLTVDNNQHEGEDTTQKLFDKNSEKRTPIKIIFPASRRPSTLSKSSGSGT